MGTATGQSPSVFTFRRDVPAQATGVSTEYPICLVGTGLGPGAVTAARYIPNAAITGANTNTRRVAIRNKAAGAGTTEMAAIQFNAGTNGVAFAASSLTLDATSTNRDATAVQVLAVYSSAVGTGLADPGGVIEVEFTRD